MRIHQALGDGMLRRLFTIGAGRVGVSSWKKGEGIGIPQLLSALGIRETPLVTLAVRSLLDSNVAPNPTAIRFVVGLLRTLQQPTPEDARLLALSEGKGLRLDHRQFEQLRLVLSGGAEGAQRERDERHREERRRRHRHRRRETEESASPITPRGKAANRQAAASRVAEALRSRVLAGVEQGDHPLQLFNHLSGGDHHWIVVPYETVGTGKRLHGSLRLCFAGVPAQVASAILAVDDEGARWRVIVTMERGSPTGLRLLTDNDRLRATAQRRLSRLRDRLPGIDIHSIESLPEEYDGFAPQPEMVSAKRIDERR